MKNYFTDAVHDVIGNTPVLDQFDTSYPASFYGSSQDDFVTGTLLVLNQAETKKQGKEVYSAQNRGRLFSKAYASSQPALDSTFGSAEVDKNPSYAERLVPWFEKTSHSHRIMQCVDEQERFYDSCLPNIKNCFSADGSSVWYTYDNPQYWLSPYGNVQSSSDMGYILFNAKPIASNPLSNNVWTWSFPYEERYKPEERVINTENIFSDINTDVTTNWYPSSFSKVKNQKIPRKIMNLLPLLPGRKQINTSDTSFRVDPSLPNNGAGSYRMLIPADIKLNNKDTPTNQYLTGSMTDEDMVRFLFGFGDLNNIAYTSFTLNDEEDEEKVLSSSYFTGFEIINFGAITSASLNGGPIPPTDSPYSFSQFNYTDNYVTVKWLSPTGKTVGQPGYAEYPWVLVARSGSVSATLDENLESSQRYNFVSGSNYFSYAPSSTPRARGQILTGSSAIYWLSSSNAATAGQTNSNETHWVLGSFLSASSSPQSGYTGPPPTPLIITTYKMSGSSAFTKSVSYQKLEVTSSSPWKLSYSRAVSANTTNYFRSSFTGMPGLPSSLGNVDIEIEKLYGTDVPFEGTNVIETKSQILTEFTSSLYPPGEYQVKFSYVKTGQDAGTGSIDRAFIDNVYVFTLGDGQLTASFDPNYRIGYNHYPQFRQIVRDTRSSPYFPGTGLKSTVELSTDIIKKLDVFNPKAIKPKYSQFSVNITDSKTLRSALTAPKTTAVFSIDSNRISTISQLSSVKNNPEILARLSAIDELASLLTNSSYGGYEIAFAPVIRGWKYGIYNGLPANSRAIFRRNRFGHFRDMLEQRLFTTFCNTDRSFIKNVARSGERSTSKFKQGISVQDGPVSVKFVRQTIDIDENNIGKIITTEIAPILTTSQNLTKNASSSTPYFDGESRSRPNDFNPDGSKLSEMIMLTSAISLPVLSTEVNAITNAPQINSALRNLTITSRR